MKYGYSNNRATRNHTLGAISRKQLHSSEIIDAAQSLRAEEINAIEIRMEVARTLLKIGRTS